MKDLKPYINAYISNWDYINNLEDYKWEAIKHFQNTFHVEGSITSRTIQGLSKHVNLLDSQTYYPLGMLIEVSKEKQDVTDKLLTNLFDETQTARLGHSSTSTPIPYLQSDHSRFQLLRLLRSRSLWC